MDSDLLEVKKGRLFCGSVFSTNRDIFCKDFDLPARKSTKGPIFVTSKIPLLFTIWGLFSAQCHVQLNFSMAVFMYLMFINGMPA